MTLPLERLLGFMRDRTADQEAAFSRVQESALRDARRRTARYDSFVDDVSQVRDGLLVGQGVTAEGAEVPLRFPWDRERGHLLSIGATGTGKTTWLSWLLEQRHCAGRAWGLIDLKGDSFALVSSWLSQVADDRRHQAVVFNPFSEAVLPMNVCKRVDWWPPEIQAYDVTLALSRLFDNDLGLHQANICRHVVLLLAESNLTLAEAPLLLRDEILCGLLAARSSNETLREFFFRTYAELPAVSKDALLGRLDALLLPEAIRLALGADTLFDFRDLLERGNPIIAFLGRGPGVPEQQAGIAGSLLFSLIVQAAYARGTGQKGGYFLAFDEFHNLADAPGMTGRFDSALATIRSYGIGLGLVAHAFSQLSGTLRDITLSNIDSAAVFRTSSRNAEHFGDFLPDDPFAFGEDHESESRKRPGRSSRHAVLQQLPNREFFWWDRQKNYPAVRVRVPEIASLSGTATTLTSSATVPRAVLRDQLRMRRERLLALVNSRSGAPGESGPPKGKRRRRSPEIG